MNRKRILIADDEEAIRMIIRMSLEGPYEFDEAGDGEEAWKKFENAQPGVDLVIMDLSMPLLDGDELMQRIRLKSPDTGIILLTGRLDYQLEHASARTHVMRKPFDNIQLAQTVRDLLAD